MEQFNIFGISGDKNYTLEDLFDIERNDDEELIAISKETFEHDTDEDAELNFKYKFIIEAVYCDGDIFYSLELVPLPESLYKPKFDKVVNSCGVEPDEVDVYDVFSYGLGILFGHTKTDGSEIDNNVLDAMANAMPILNSFRGYQFDKFQNRAGNTGWDYLYDYIKGIDSTKALLDRWEKEKC